MQKNLSERLHQVAKLLACALIMKTVGSILLEYRNYLPPSFESGFLHGRKNYFWEGYHWAFYLHLIAGPATLICGTVLLSERFRLRYPGWHRNLGRFQVTCILFLIAPSGVWMALYAQTGALAGSAFALLAIATGWCAWRGWRTAVQHCFAAHRCWMIRCFLLLCSAIVLRLLAGIFTVAGSDGEWTYILAAWMSWTIPLLIFEWLRSRGVFKGYAVERDALNNIPPPADYRSLRLK